MCDRMSNFSTNTISTDTRFEDNPLKSEVQYSVSDRRLYIKFWFKKYVTFQLQIHFIDKINILGYLISDNRKQYGEF